MKRGNQLGTRSCGGEELGMQSQITDVVLASSGTVFRQEGRRATMSVHMAQMPKKLPSGLRRARLFAFQETRAKVRRA